MIIDTGNQTNDDIIAKVKQLIESGCETILLTACNSIVVPEADTAYEANVAGYKSDVA